MYTGTFYMNDGKLIINVEGNKPFSWSEREAFLKRIRKDLLPPMYAVLTMLGFNLEKQEHIFNYSHNRYGRKGDLRCDLLEDYGKIELKFFQNFNAPNRPDSGGRYEWDILKLMPYVMRLEVKRTMLRVLSTLKAYNFQCDVEMIDRLKKIGPGPGQETIEQRLQREGGKYDSGLSFESNIKGANGEIIQSGDRVYYYDFKGRVCCGRARYNINSMWWVITGKYGYQNKGVSELYKNCPIDPRIKNNSVDRKRKLSQVKFNCTMQGDFKRADAIQAIIDKEYGEIGLLITRDQAREYFTKCGLTLNTITKPYFDDLRKRVNVKLKSSGIFRNSYAVNRKTKFKDSGKSLYAYIGCKSDYFSDREAVQFNTDGFIGFAGWADSVSVRPILEAFVEWCDDIKRRVERRNGLLSHV